MSLAIQYTVLERFLRYVKIDTQSDPGSNSFPSTEKQKDLSKVLVKELHQMGISDAEMDEYGYVYATIESNSDKEVPIICFCAHVDTAPDASGTDVKPIIHKNYDGADIVLPDDNNIVISKSTHPDLNNQMGNDIITASGLTLLGADDKAGVAEIMDATNFFQTHPEVKHGKIRLLFTPDEEVGQGVDHVDMKRLAANFGYTMDGSEAGGMECETFSADGVKVIIHGVSVHPGYAKGTMENAIKIAGEIVSKLPKETLCPEATEGKEGFIHPMAISGELEQAEINFIIRDFTDEKLKAHEAVLQNICEDVIAEYPNSSFEFTVQEQYRNMKKVLDKYPQVADFAEQAIQRADLKPVKSSIRGGTDGSRLSFIGLPCPNVFTGGHAFHSKQEWVSVQDLQKAVETIVHLAMIWEENA